MAKKPPTTCMFCDEYPCVCDTAPQPKRAARKKAPAKSKPKPEVEAKPKRSKAQQDEDKVEDTFRAPQPSGRRKRRLQKDLPTSRAIRALAGAGLLDKSELTKHKEILDPPVTGRLMEHMKGDDEDGRETAEQEEL